MKQPKQKKNKNSSVKEPESKKQISRKMSRNVIVGTTIIILFIIMTVLYNTNENARNLFDKYIFRKDVYEGNLPYIKIDAVNVGNVYAYGKNIMVLKENTLKAYNRVGREEYSIDVKIKNPLFVSKGKYLCLADKSGQKIYLISGGNIIWQKDLTGEIANICVSQKGYIAVSMSDTNYKTVVEVYNNDGNKVFSKYLSTTNVIDIEISNDNKYLAIAEADFSGIIIQSSITTISIEEAKKNVALPTTFTHTAAPGDLIISIQYNNKDNLICMYDGHIDFIKNNVNKQITGIVNEDILFADIQMNSHIVKAIRQHTETYNTKTEMQIVNSSNIDSEKAYIIEGVPQKVYTCEDKIAINLGTEVLFINGNGWLVKRYNASHEVKDIVLSNNLAGIIYKDKIEIISL